MSFLNILLFLTNKEVDLKNFKNSVASKKVQSTKYPILALQCIGPLKQLGHIQGIKLVPKCRYAQFCVIFL